MILVWYNAKVYSRLSPFLTVYRVVRHNYIVMNVSRRLGEQLAKIHLAIFLSGEDASWRVAEEAVEEAGRHGLKAFRRAEGYALMENEAVGRLGLPHLRVVVYGLSLIHI